MSEMHTDAAKVTRMRLIDMSVKAQFIGTCDEFRAKMHGGAAA